MGRQEGRRAQPCKEPDDRGNDRWSQVAAEVKGREKSGERVQFDERGTLDQHEQGPRILGLPAHHYLRLCFREIEWQTFHLRSRSYDKQDSSQRLRQNEPSIVLLKLNYPSQVQSSSYHHYSQRREP